MSKYIKAGETIHGKSVDLIVRKFVRVGLKKHPITNKTMLLFVSDRNSEGEIKKPINIDDFSSEHLKKMEHYHRNLGDQVECDSLSIYLDSKSRKKIEVIGGHSGRHKAQIGRAHV